MRLVSVAVAAGVLVAASDSGGRTPAAADPRTLPGWGVYDRYCLACHGAAGDGRGPAAPLTWPRPRDLTRGAYAWRATAFGEPPTDDDLRTTIRRGVPGTSMQGYGDVLSEVEISQLLEVVKAFSPAAFARPGRPISLGAPAPRDPERGARLWTQLGCDGCHGARGRGDGPSARTMNPAPYDLTTLPLRRPRASDDAEARRGAAVASIATGLAGTAMPGYAPQVATADLWALADHVVALGANAPPHDRRTLPEPAIAADRVARLPTGTWPGSDPIDARVFGTPLAEQGLAPAGLAPAEASLSARQCARCHAAQARQWQGSVHAAAATWGLPARALDHAADGDSCARCHTPLAEQQGGAAFDPELRDEGVTCAGCHVRSWVRHGPPGRAPSLLASPAYARVELAIYQRADFCMPCHQLPPRNAVRGKPLLDTYREWLESPYMRRGIQCQHCHMPSREHTWLGIHDRDTFRQGVRLDVRAHRTDGRVTVVAELANVGAGHYLPTTPTPAVWLRVELVDERGTPIDGARAELRIGRDVVFERGAWHERSDTRLAPGEQLRMARAWSGGRTASATSARVSVEVHPDDHYERLYETRLRGQLPADTRRAYQQALARARAARYIAEQRDAAIEVQSTR
jgi:mono/diheme cytochrome c family protein